MSYIPLTPFSADAEQATAFPAEETLAALANARRRTVLSVLYDRGEPLSNPALATRVAARELGKPAANVTDDERESVEITLHHRHLPKLTDLGLVERTIDEKTAVTADALDVASMSLLDVPDESRIPGIADTDTLFDALADDQRRALLAVLAEVAEPLDVETLAEIVGDHDTTGPDAEFPAADSTRMEIALHHRHLPKLEDAGLVTYDTDAGTVTYEGHPFLRDEWVDPDAAPVEVGPMPTSF